MLIFKRIIFFLSFLLIALTGFSQNTRSLPYWGSLNKNTSVSLSDSVIVWDHSLLIYRKISFENFISGIGDSTLTLKKSNNLSDLPNKSTARTNLGVPSGSGTSTGTNTGDHNYYKGNIDLSSNPNYPSGVLGDIYRVSVLGKIGGASGKALGIDDRILCIATSAGGTEAAVGENGTTPGWIVIRALHPLSTTALTAGSTVTVDFGNKMSVNKSLSDSRTNITFTASNNIDAAECLIEFTKTQVNNDTLTFTSAYKVMSEGLPQPSTSCVISSSSTTGIFIISLKMLNSRLYATVKNYGY